ncbi:MAG: choice-of-anchor D domain-containing protein [Candidatus Marinimicrobia bacterium]|nr:choice-of-anchor D domain-containing protein [Candidatus Neomarinimicrobiota bacterium]
MQFLKCIGCRVAPLLLAAAQLAPGATIRIAGGTWQAASHLRGTNLVVEAAGRLSGTGTVHMAATIRGEVSPGRGPADVGTLSFTDALTFDGGQFACHVAAFDAADLLSVAGRVSGAARVVTSCAGGVAPDQLVIVSGAANSDYSLFDVAPATGWVLGQSGALNLHISGLPGISVLGTNGAVIASAAAPSPVTGTDFGHVHWGRTVTNTFSITNGGIATLTIQSSHLTEQANFSMAGIPATLPAGGVSNFNVVYAPMAVGSHAAAVIISNSAPDSPFTVNLAGACYALSTNIGPFAGGNTITITNGHFGAITNVLVDLVDVIDLVDSGVNWVTVVMPALGAAGPVDIIIQTSDNGDTFLYNAYTYNPAGIITNVSPALGSWTGAVPLVIEGSNLGNGADITNVTLCGVAATISSQATERVWIVAAASGAGALTGDVVVSSTSFGTTTRSNAFEYTKEAQAITFDPIAAKTYGDAAFDPGATASSGLAVSYSSSDANVATVSVHDIYITGTGVCDIVASQAGNSFYHAAPSITNNLAVTRKELSVTGAVASNKVYDATATAWLSGATLQGAVPGDEVTLANAATGTFAQATTGTAIGVTTHMTLTGTHAPQYHLRQPTGLSADITARELTVTGAMAQSKVYDGTKAAAITGAGLSGVQGSDVITLGNHTTGTFANANAGTGVTVHTHMTISGDQVANYTLTQPTLSADITKADQAITFDALSDVFWTNVVDVAATADSGLAVSLEVVSGPASLTDPTSPTTLTMDGYGAVRVAASQAGDTNWNAAVTVTNTFNALGPQFTVLGTNGVVVVHDNVAALPDGTDFGSARIGLETVTHVFAITNAGTAEATVLGIVTNGPQAGSFAILNPPTAVPMNGAVEFSVAFDPQAGETNRASLVFTFDGTNAPYQVNMAGFGYGGALGFTSNGLSFSGTYVGADPVNQTLMLTNSGSSAINWTNVITYGVGATDWLTVTPTDGNLLKQSAAELAAAVSLAGLNAGTYYATNTFSAPGATNSPQAFAVALTVAKADQVITNYLPPDGAHFIFGSATTVSAQVRSELPVAFENLTPDIALLVAPDITFTNPGVAQVRATQVGNANWNAAAPVTHIWRVGGLITNVTPGAANVGGGLDVLVQGLWLGDGVNIATVRLAAVRATVISQNVHEVTVRAGRAPGVATGDVVVVSATGGEMVLSNAFEYLWLAAPVQHDPVDVTSSSLVARWDTVPAATRHYLEVGLDTNYTAHLAEYDWVDVALARQYPVAGLTDGTWYALREFAWNQHGLSWPSRTVWIPATTNTPYETHPPQSGPVSQGAVMEHPLNNMFHGAGLVYSVQSSDPGVVAAEVTAGGVLRLTPVGPGTAEITLRATNPATGYTATYRFTIEVIGRPTLVSQAFKPREPWNPRFTQTLVVRNDSGLEAIGTRVLFSNLMPGITVENQTGTAWDGRPMIEMEAPFPAGASMSLDIVYLCTGKYTVDKYPPTIELQYILPAWRPPLPGGGTWVDIQGVLPDGRIVLEFDSVPGLYYAIEYMNDFPEGAWRQVVMRLKAGANRTQWIDSGPPATLPPSGVRIYRVKQVQE